MSEQSDGLKQSFTHLRPTLPQSATSSSEGTRDGGAFSTPALSSPIGKQVEALLDQVSRLALQAQLSYLDGQHNQVAVALGELQEQLTQVSVLLAKDESMLNAAKQKEQDRPRTFEELPSCTQRWSLIAMLLDVEPQHLAVSNFGGPTMALTGHTASQSFLFDDATAEAPPLSLSMLGFAKDEMMPMDTGLSSASSGDDGEALTGFSGILEPSRNDKLEQSLLLFLDKVCRDVNYCDSKGRALHQVLASRRSSISLPMFVTYKFRIEAFTLAFYEYVQQQFDEFDVKECRAFLRGTPYIARFNESGSREKSKGNFVWRVDASKDDVHGGGGDGGVYRFRKFERIIIAPPALAYQGAKWDWPLRVWDPHVPSAELKPVFTAAGLPNWLAWKQGKRSHLFGTPDNTSSSARFTVTAEVTVDGQETVETVSLTVELEVKSAKRTASSSRSNIDDSPTEQTTQPPPPAFPLLPRGEAMQMSDQDQRKLIRHLMIQQQQKATAMPLNLPSAARRKSSRDQNKE